jgi:hypothetical protein
MKDFFISYNSADRLWAEWIAWQLEEGQYTTVIQAWDFRPGMNFVLEMQRATTEARHTIAVLSPDYVASCFTQPEWAAAFAQDPKGEKRILIPVRVQAFTVEGILRSIIYIDLVGLDEVRAKAELIAGVRPDRKPPRPPIFPAGHSVAKPQYYPGGTDAWASFYRNLAVLRSDSPPDVMHKAAQAIADETDHAVLVSSVQELAACYRRIQDATTHFWIALAIGKAATPESKEVLTQLRPLDEHPYAQRGITNALNIW